MEVKERGMEVLEETVHFWLRVSLDSDLWQPELPHFNQQDNKKQPYLKLSSFAQRLSQNTKTSTNPVNKVQCEWNTHKTTKVDKWT